MIDPDYSGDPEGPDDPDDPDAHEDPDDPDDRYDPDDPGDPVAVAVLLLSERTSRVSLVIFVTIFG